MNDLLDMCRRGMNTCLPASSSDQREPPARSAQARSPSCPGVNFLVAVNFLRMMAPLELYLDYTSMRNFLRTHMFAKTKFRLRYRMGSVAVLNLMTHHRTGYNVAKDFVRRAVIHAVGASFMAPQIDIRGCSPAAEGIIAKTPSLRDFLGYRWNTAPDPLGAAGGSGWLTRVFENSRPIRNRTTRSAQGVTTFALT